MKRFHVMGYRSNSLADTYYFGAIAATSESDAIRQAKASPAWTRERIREAHASAVTPNSKPHSRTPSHHDR